MINKTGFVLVKPQLPENIGFSARCLKNFGFSSLDLVNPKENWPNKKAIATARVRQKGKSVLKIERVAVLLEFRRLKVGSIIIKNIIKHYMNLDYNKSIILHSQVSVADFYKTLNFISYGTEFFEDGISHIAMKYVKT